VKVRYRERALADIEAIFSYLNARSPTEARNVLMSIANAIDIIAAQPDSAQRTSDATVRAKTVGSYRYKIFYSVEGDTVEIIHVRHGARRPWL
jgi:plasmid stabilization system protein ParE